MIGSSAGGQPGAFALPAKFTALRDIMEEKVKVGLLYNVIGLVQDCQLPIKTAKTDWKMKIRLVDASIIDEASWDVPFDIFRPERDMPEVGLGDVVVLQRVKVQSYHSNPYSLITNHQTSIRVFKASDIPKPPKSAQSALRPCPKRDVRPELTSEESQLVSRIYHAMDKNLLVDEETFKVRVDMSLNVKDKFSLLKDAKADHYYNVIAQVVRDPYFDYDDKVTMYVSDYTENPHFRLQTWEDLGRDGGDPWGYTSTDPDPEPTRPDWHGPDGKRSIQLTIFEPHANTVRDEKVAVGQWLFIQNLHVTFGHDSNALEGKLHSDMKHPSKVNIHVLDVDEPDTIEPRLKERLKDALRRCRDAEKEKAKQIKAIKSAADAGQKRKATDDLDQKLRAKQRRLLKRQAAQSVSRQDTESPSIPPQDSESRPPSRQAREPPRQQQQQRQQEQQQSNAEEADRDLNPNIICEHRKKTSRNKIGELLRNVTEDIVTDDSNGTTNCIIPYINKSYLPRVRVVDFHPSALEDFAIGKKLNKYRDLFSDEEQSSENSDDDGNDPTPRTRAWEWSFALQLEDVPPPGTNFPKERVWVLVDNHAGQCLTDLDATDLHMDKRALTKLREKLFVLWGNLEEVKKSRSQPPQDEEKKERPVSRGGTGSGKGKGKGKRGGRMAKPPIEESEEEEKEEAAAAAAEVDLFNKPFLCPINQYGMHDKKNNQWVRSFGLFGVRIRS
ncbi:hypothetical protein QBC35DRAFT_482113 [Podospora australis]|uniref:Protection of telomeres protein 1 n=1 Tax=Podospora australis TaxID=1536484 RepID=A0AAN6X3X0_9PEZI|nr:hypothetical protein QBC35DRAFT_482113 [Podospora australis]